MKKVLMPSVLCAALIAVAFPSNVTLSAARIAAIASGDLQMPGQQTAR